MYIFATVDQNWAIGKNGARLYPIPIDRVYFNESTKSRYIVYGRNSIPTISGYADTNMGQRHIILTHDTSFTQQNATIIHSITELDAFPTDDVYIVGGASVFQQLYRHCKYAFLTRVESVTLDSDAFFPRIDQRDNWIPIEQTSVMHYQGLPFRFVTYRNTDLD